MHLFHKTRFYKEPMVGGDHGIRSYIALEPGQGGQGSPTALLVTISHY